MIEPRRVPEVTFNLEASGTYDERGIFRPMFGPGELSAYDRGKEWDEPED